MEEEPQIEQEQETCDTNIDISGNTDHILDYRTTLCFVTRLELEALLIRRHAQLDNPSSPHNRLHPKIEKRMLKGNDILKYLLAELLDPTIDYPIKIRRGDKVLRVHKDLPILPEIADVMVMKDRYGKVSYNTVSEDISKDEVVDAREEETKIVDKLVRSIGRYF